MKDSNKLLQIILIVISILVLYLVFTGNNNLREAKKIITNVNGELKAVKDSVNSSRKSINELMNKLEYTKIQLEMNKNERDILETQVNKMLANNWEELQRFKKEITDLNEKNSKLEKKAKTLIP
jgi:septal ring factor EnvC (AmiA/AmiB activator)